MRRNGLLIAAVTLLVVGLLGSAATAAVMLASSAYSGNQFGSRSPRFGRGVPSTETTSEATSSPTPRRGPGGRVIPPPGGYSSVGESIWFAGVGANGSIPREPAFGPAMMGGCAVCHGDDGRGTRFRMMGRTFDAPDVRFSTLSRPRTEEGKSEPAWTGQDVLNAVRDGREPGGNLLDDTMPRWAIDSGDFDELLAYMERL